MAAKKKGKAKREARRVQKGTARKKAESIGVTGADAKAVAALNSAQVSGGIWKGQVKGDTLVGNLLSLKEEDGRFGRQTVAIIGTTEGARTFFLNESALRSLESTGAKPGDRIGFQYKGSTSTGKGRPFKLYVASLIRRKAVEVPDSPF